MKPHLKLVKAQCAEFEPCFIEALPKVIVEALPETFSFFTSETGHLSFDQLKLMMNALPVDLTLIDEEDKVCYFNTTSDRLFPRSAAVIGRNVRNCHPAESVHVVNEILSAFKNNTRQEATFWIHMKDKFILIKYVALRDEKQHYQGCLEITQEISEIQALSGNKRLLDWNLKRTTDFSCSFFKVLTAPAIDGSSTDAVFDHGMMAFTDQSAEHSLTGCSGVMFHWGKVTVFVFRGLRCMS